MEKQYLRIGNEVILFVHTAPCSSPRQYIDLTDRNLIFLFYFLAFGLFKFFKWIFQSD